MSRRKRRTSPGRSRSTGLFFTLIAAIVVGAAGGSYVSRLMSVPDGAGSTATPPASRRHRTSVPARTRVETRETVTPSTSASQVPPASKPGRSPERLHRPRGLAGEISRVPGSKMVALTLDAGASSAPTPAVLSALKSAGVRVTFFLTGRWCEQNEDLVRQIHEEGHEIGNHTYSHPDLRKLTDEEIREQLEKTADIIARLTGAPCAPYFRPPYGGRDHRVLKATEKSGYTCVYWSVDSWDAFKKGITSKEIEDRVIGRVRGGDVVLMHCGSQATADALPSLIRELEARGYEIVTVSELVR